MKPTFNLLVDRLAEYDVEINNVVYNSCRHWAKYQRKESEDDRRESMHRFAKLLQDAFAEYLDFVVSNLIVNSGGITLTITYNNHVFVIEFKTNCNAVIDYTNKSPDFFGQADVWYDLLMDKKIRLETLTDDKIFWTIKNHQLVKSLNGKRRTR